MHSEQELPTDWVLESEETRYDSMMGREYTTVIYRQEDTGKTVRINEVVNPKTTTWGYYVQHSGRNGELGTEENLDTAKQTALSYITESQAA